MLLCLKDARNLCFSFRGKSHRPHKLNRRCCEVGSCTVDALAKKLESVSKMTPPNAKISRRGWRDFVLEAHFTLNKTLSVSFAALCVIAIDCYNNARPLPTPTSLSSQAIQVPETFGDVLGAMRQPADEGMTIALVTHEISFLRKLTDWIVVFDQGRGVEAGPPIARRNMRDESGICRDQRSCVKHRSRKGQQWF
jgi:hypothetical protein